MSLPRSDLPFIIIIIMRGGGWCCTQERRPPTSFLNVNGMIVLPPPSHPVDHFHVIFSCSARPQHFTELCLGVLLTKIKWARKVENIVKCVGCLRKLKNNEKNNQLKKFEVVEFFLENNPYFFLSKGSLVIFLNILFFEVWRLLIGSIV